MQAVILAAGRGKRLAPLTDNQPKVMVPVAGQPLVERLSRQLVANGLRDQIIVVGYMKDMVMSHLGNGSAWGANITYVTQDDPKGTGHAVRMAAPHITGDFCMVFGDSLLESDMIADVLQAPTVGAIGCAQVDDPSRFGILSIDAKHQVTGIVEKPINPPSNLAMMAIYKFPYAMAAAVNDIKVSERGEIELPDAVRTLIAQGVPFTAVDITGVMDIGTMADWEHANQVVKRVA
jgi:glucose-1-phosphate thymidylyltransferase